MADAEARGSSRLAKRLHFSGIAALRASMNRKVARNGIAATSQPDWARSQNDGSADAHGATGMNQGRLDDEMIWWILCRFSRSPAGPHKLVPGRLLAGQQRLIGWQRNGTGRFVILEEESRSGLPGPHRPLEKIVP